jgi:hypothetical protein
MAEDLTVNNLEVNGELKLTNGYTLKMFPSDYNLSLWRRTVADNLSVFTVCPNGSPSSQNKSGLNIWYQDISGGYSNASYLELTAGSQCFSTDDFVIGVGKFGDGANKKLHLGINSTVKALTVDTNANIGIGDTSPTASLHIKAGSADSSKAPLKFTLTNASLLTTPEAGALEADSSGNLYMTNSSGVRKSLQFTESGTWTPAISFGGNSVGVAYNSSYTSGAYTKIGDRIIFNGTLLLTSKGTSTGDAVISGLPYTASSNSAYFYPVSIFLNVVSFADYPQARVERNSNNIIFWEISNDGSLSTLTHTNFSDTSLVVINGSYLI